MHELFPVVSGAVLGIVVAAVSFVLARAAVLRLRVSA